jgi:GNAT superfamily N-acetyltransferase
LRGKIDSLVKSKNVNSLKVPAKIKQLVDGFLSYLKKHMLENIDAALYHVKSNEIGLNKEYKSLFWSFELEDELQLYYKKIRESQIIKPADSSALRSWMLECLKKMKELHVYFQELPTKLEQEYYDRLDEDKLEDENFSDDGNKLCQGEIIFIADGSSEEWVNQQIPQLFKGSGIRMMSNDEPYSIYASEEKEEVYGVLVYHQSGYEEDELGDEKPILYFSVAVKENCRKQNIATKLIEDFVQSHKHHAILKGEVWNPILYNTLSKLGFVEEEDLSTHPDHPIKLFTLK